MAGSETLFAELSEVTDPATGAIKQMEGPLILFISKTQPRYVYPMIYERDFPYYAYEKVMQTSKYDCNDDGFGDEPTCGWQIDPLNGSQLAHSQGFCCSCDLVNIFEEVEATRGSNCELFNVGEGASSAHCLRFSEEETWYKAYTMQPPRLKYTIEVFSSLAVTSEEGDLAFSEEKI